MPDAAWSALIGPAVLLLLGFIINEMIRPMLVQRRQPERPSPIVGEAIPADPAEPWRLAHAAVTAERDRLLSSLSREEGEHDQCHALMRTRGLTPPHD